MKDENEKNKMSETDKEWAAIEKSRLKWEEDMEVGIFKMKIETELQMISLRTSVDMTAMAARQPHSLKERREEYSAIRKVIVTNEKKIDPKLVQEWTGIIDTILKTLDSVL